MSSSTSLAMTCGNLCGTSRGRQHRGSPSVADTEQEKVHITHPELRFMDLSGEIRNNVYAMWMKGMPTVRIPDDGAGTGLLGTCRAIRNEVFGLYYDFDNMAFTSPKLLYRFLDSRTQATKGSITGIRFRYDGLDPWAFDALHELSLLPNLRELEIWGSDAMGFDSPGVWSLQRLRKVHLTFSKSWYGKKTDFKRAMRRILSHKRPFDPALQWYRMEEKLRRRFSERLRQHERSNRLASLRRCNRVSKVGVATAGRMVPILPPSDRLAALDEVSKFT